jgi:hypothetical protein
MTGYTSPVFGQSGLEAYLDPYYEGWTEIPPAASAGILCLRSTTTMSECSPEYRHRITVIC